MKKKNLIWSMFAIMMVTMLSVGLSACGSDDDDDNGGGSGSSSSVVGTWKGEMDEDVTLSLTFKNNGTGTYVVTYEDSFYDDEVERGSFTYSMTDSKSGIIIIRYNDEYSGSITETYDFEIDGKRMYLHGNYGDSGVLTKQ